MSDAQRPLWPNAASLVSAHSMAGDADFTLVNKTGYTNREMYISDGDAEFVLEDIDLCTKCEVAVRYEKCGAYALSKYSGSGAASNEQDAKKKALGLCNYASCKILAAECNWTEQQRRGRCKSTAR